MNSRHRGLYELLPHTLDQTAASELISVISNWTGFFYRTILEVHVCSWISQQLTRSLHLPRNISWIDLRHAPRDNNTYQRRARRCLGLYSEPQSAPTHILQHFGLGDSPPNRTYSFDSSISWFCWFAFSLALSTVRLCIKSNLRITRNSLLFSAWLSILSRCLLFSGRALICHRSRCIRYLYSLYDCQSPLVSCFLVVTSVTLS